MMKKTPWPVADIRHWLEPGPVLLVSSQSAGERNLMTMGWHSVMEFSPALVGCVISAGNRSFQTIRSCGECVLNLPTADMVETVSRIGNCSGSEGDKFERFGLTEEVCSGVSAPGIVECHASFGCRLYDDALVDSYNFFIFEVVSASVKPSPKWPNTLHYAGDGQFRTDGAVISRRRLFTKVS